MKKLIATLVLFLITSPASAATFSDVSSSDPDYAAISDVTAREIANGPGDGTFGPDRLVTRAEATKFIARTMGFDCSLYKESTSDTEFSDIANAVGLEEYVKCFNGNDFVSGYADGTFRPQQTVLETEFLKMLYRAAGISVDTANPPVYADLADPTLSPYMALAIQHQIRPAAVNNSVGNKSLLRRDVARYLHNLIDYVELNNPSGRYAIPRNTEVAGSPAAQGLEVYYLTHGDALPITVLDTSNQTYTHEVDCWGPLQRDTFEFTDTEEATLTEALTSNTFFNLKSDFTENCDTEGNCISAPGAGNLVITASLNGQRNTITYSYAYFYENDPELQRFLNVKETLDRLISQRFEELELSPSNCGHA